MFLIIAFLFVNDPSIAQWKPANTLPGGYVLCFAQKGNNLYIGTGGGGIYVSDDGGLNFHQTNSGLGNLTIKALAVSNGVLFAAVGDALTAGKVYRSTDEGASWALANNGLPSNRKYFPQWQCIAVAPNGGSVFVGTLDGGVFVTKDTGSTWVADTAGLFKYVTAMAVHDTNLYAGTISGVYRSTTDVGPWIATANADLHRMEVKSLVAMDSVILASGWVFGGDVNGIYRSTNKGDSWTEVYQDHRFHYSTPVEALGPMIVMDSEIFAATSKGSILASVDQGQTWSLLDTIPGSPEVRSFFVKDSVIFAGTYGLGVFCSTDRGLSWYPTGRGLANTKIQAIALWDEIIFAGTSGVGVFRSTDAGISWVQVNNGLTDLNVLALAATDSGLFAGCFGSIFRTTDGGLHWTRITSGGIQLTATMGLAAMDMSLFAGTLQIGVFRSTDQGASWDTASAGLPRDIVTALAASKPNLYAGLSHSGVWLSTDAGDSWHNASNGITDPYIVSLAANGTNVYATTRSGNLFLSTNNGGEWATVDSNSMNANVLSMAANEAYLFVGTSDYGLMYRPVSGLVSVDAISNTLPTLFALGQNYPNPFNPSTTIRYALAAKSHVKISVYDELGREITTLIDAEQDAGWNEVVWNAKGSSGPYFCRMEAISTSVSGTRFVSVKKMLLLK